MILTTCLPLTERLLQHRFLNMVRQLSEQPTAQVITDTRRQQVFIDLHDVYVLICKEQKLDIQLPSGRLITFDMISAEKAENCIITCSERK